MIRKIWNLAIEQISVADEIIIWGYSLPPTDFYAYWLLKNTNKMCSKFVLINPGAINRNKDKKNLTFLKPFRDVFSWVDKSRTELYEYFKDYYAKRDIYEKYNI
jgi:hypothetical protein